MTDDKVFVSKIVDKEFVSKVEAAVIDPKIVIDLEQELRAANKYGDFRSTHDGYAVLQEEVDELWEEVKKNPRVRSQEKMRQEAVQVAAMAIKFIQILDKGIDR